MIKVKAALIRGGTSKGLFFNESDLPADNAKRDQLLLSIMGSPDPSGMQLNGVGGGISSTSKVVLIKKSEKQNIDVDYLFGQVSTTKAKIDWAGSCGNLAAAVGLYAINNGLTQLNNDGSTCIRVWQVNLGYAINVHFPQNSETNLISIPGVPGVGRPIYVEFLNPSGGRSLLPKNQPIHLLELPSGKIIQSTLILGANPTIFVKAVDLGLLGNELPNQ
ncbi:MAG TPA: PrpF domain-containing protein, partial [Aquella sp.]|nr:PrpF domain-containing protein [Aquella sp.]